jgi:hypothetical protein
MTNLSTELREKLEKAVKELSNSMARAAAERDLQKEILKAAEESTTLEKKLIRKMAKVYYKNEFNDVKIENEQFETSYLEVFGTNG